MQRKTTLIASISCLILAAGIAQADTTTFTGGGNPTGIWDLGANWDNGIPTAADRAVIPSGKTCTINITTAVADTIDVEGTLNIAAGKKLTLDNGDDNFEADPDNSIVNGTVTLAGSGSALAFIDNDHGVSGTGIIDGTNNDARIDIEADIKLTNRISVTGNLTIKGLTGGTVNGTFRNDGRVIAEGDGLTLLLHDQTILEDHNTADQAKWIATDCGTLKFDRSTGLSGEFNLDCGTFHFSAPTRICGTFTWDMGAIIVDTGDYFAYQFYASGTSCSNPENTPPSSRDCTVWQIDDSGSPYSCGACCK